MLVSAIARFRAIGTQYSANAAMMRSCDAKLDGIRTAGMNGTNFYALHQMDTKNDLDIARAQLMYQYATAWKKSCEAQMRAESKKLNVLA